MKKLIWTIGAIACLALVLALIGLVGSNQSASLVGNGDTGEGYTNYTSLGLDSTFSLNGRQMRAGKGTFDTSTTTFVSIANPFTSTSTCSIRVEETGLPASSVAIVVGTSTYSSVSQATKPTGTLISATWATSTVGGYISSGDILSGSGASTQYEVTVPPSAYVVGFATNTYAGSLYHGVTVSSSTFAGTYSYYCFR